MKIVLCIRASMADWCRWKWGYSLTDSRLRELHGIVSEKLSPVTTVGAIEAAPGDMYLISRMGGPEELTGVVRAAMALAEDPRLNDLNPAAQHPHLKEMGAAMAIAYGESAAGTLGNPLACHVEQSARALASIACEKQFIIEQSARSALEECTGEFSIDPEKDPPERAIVGLDGPWPVSRFVMPGEALGEVISAPLLSAQLNRFVKLISDTNRTQEDTRSVVSEFEKFPIREKAEPVKDKLDVIALLLAKLAEETERGIELGHEKALVKMLEEAQGHHNQARRELTAFYSAKEDAQPQHANLVASAFYKTRDQLGTLRETAAGRIGSIDDYRGLYRYLKDAA
jgi:hypothetical protein